MKPFAAPLDDILFSLEHVAKAHRLPGWHGALAREIGKHFSQLAEGEIAPLNGPGDLEGCRLENGRVVTPRGYKAAFHLYAEQGWAGLTVPENFGGQGISHVIESAIVTEITIGACPSFAMATNLIRGASRTLLNFGTPEQQATYLPRLAGGEWLATMCLTEPEAGSDLSGVRTRATRSSAGWVISGEKIFISGGDHDLSEGILHLVLARTGAIEDGLKGLSLFLCPSIDDAGKRNAVSVTRIEEKMGLHGSPTCQMRFEDANAELIGEEGQGLLAMFTMMNSARIGTALLGVALAARATDLAVTYAAERKQGGVFIDQHADVARMLSEMDALALGMRAMGQTLLVTLDAGDDPDLVDFLTPVCKVFCTEGAIEAANLAIQVMGGYGYLHEYGAEQILRDGRISAIYEGANGIHASVLATRMLRLKDGGLADAFARHIGEIAAGCGQATSLDDGLALWLQARQRVLAAENPKELAHAFMQLTGALTFRAAWCRLLDAAERSHDPDRIRRLESYVRRTYAAKIRYWADLCA